MVSPLFTRFLVFAAIITLTAQTGVINSLTSDSTNINVVTNYTWIVVFNSTDQRGSINITFPPTCVLFSTTTVLVNSLPVTATNSSNVLIVTNDTLLFGTVNITVRGVQNPFAAYTYTTQFTISSAFDGTITNYNGIPYNVGTFASSSWKFSLCTEQPNSVLTVNVTTTNTIPSGDARFEVGYGGWINHYNKNLLSNYISVTSQASINGTTTTVNTTTPDTANQRIIIIYNAPTNLNAGTILVFNISGVQSPPTQTTPTNSSFRVATTDLNGIKIDQQSSCTIQSTCVLTLNTGIFNNTIMPVNSIYSSNNPVIMYAQSPTITFQNGDTIEFYFTPLSNFNACNTLQFWRNISNNFMVAPLSQTSSFYTYTLSSSFTANIDYSFNITLKPMCSSVTITSSQTPVTTTFKFKRNGAQYLELSATMLPSATLITTSNAAVSLSNYELIKSSVSYTLSVRTAQPLGPTPTLKFTFSNEITLTIPSCSVTISTGSVSSSLTNCSYNPSTSVLTLNFTALSTIISSTNITVIITGFTNPSSPISRSFGVQTYYDAAVSTSRVEYNSTAFPVTFTGITSYPATFSPSSLTVYSNTSTTISFINSIIIPSGSTIYVQFPTAATNVSLTGSPLAIGVTSTNAVPTNYNNNSFIVTTSADIPVNSALNINCSIVSPSTMGSFNYVILRVQKSGKMYMESTTSMFLFVNSVVAMLVTVAPVNGVTGAPSGYIVTMTLSVPHPANFYIQVDLPSDVNYTSSAASCSGNCSNAIIGTSNFTSFIIDATNSLPSSTSQMLTFNLAAAFTNPRSVGTSLPWNFTTKSITPANTITISSASPYISTANTLTISMLSDSYYKNNPNVVKINFGFSNTLMTGDYIQMQISTLTYSQKANETVNCSPIYGTCTKSTSSTASLLVITIVPNLAFITNKQRTMILQGVVSGTSIVDNVLVETRNSSNHLIDSGYMVYQLSCKDSSKTSILNYCKTCNPDGTCITCYATQGFYLNVTTCVTSCGDATMTLTYDNNASGQCASCTNNCYTCLSATNCLSCVSGYFYLLVSNSCLATCTSAGYAQFNVSGVQYCSQCYGAACLQCTSNAAGTCTLCDSSSVLSNGMCSNGCANASFYPSGGICYNCDISCATCVSGGNGGCTKCALNYYNYTSFCLSVCPTDTAPSVTGKCMCDAPCSKCVGSTTNCTACINSSLFVSQGSCLSSCPTNSYLSGSTCMPCGTGCVNCTATTCFSCISTNYLYNNLCYSDCNQIGQQYDASGTTCIMCPDGCDTCERATCFSCLSNYTLSSGTSQCVKTCLLTSSCDISGQQIIPFPGLISAVVWCIIVVIIKLVMHKSYVPYSLIIGTSVIQFVLIIATIANSGDIVSYSFRLLVASSAERLIIRGLLGGALAINYISNIIYIVLFVKYIKPLITNPRQIDIIANVVVLVFGTLTNYRFAIIAFSKMFPKPSIYIQNQSKLTPVHYLAISSLVLDIIPLGACIIAVLNEQALTNLFMLGIDLLLIIVFNIFVTIWFVSCKKGDDYFENEIKKYHTNEDHNNTQENIDNSLDNEKNISKANMANQNETFNFEEEDFASKNDQYNSNYKKMANKSLKNSIKTPKESQSIIKKISPSNISKQEDEKASEESDLNIDISSVSIRGKKKIADSRYTAEQDVNFEQGLKSKHGTKSAAKIPTRDRMNFNETLKSDGKSVEDGLGSKKKSQTENFSKQTVTSARKNYLRPEKDIQEVQEEADLGDLPEQSNNESVFDRQKQKLSKPYRAGDKRPTKDKKPEKPTKLEEPLKIMKKENKIGYFDTDAYESNAEEDIESIIKQKVWQSAAKQQKPKQTDNQLPQNSNSETEYEEISPSWFNIQNQRIEMSDFGDKESEP